VVRVFPTRFGNNVRPVPFVRPIVLNRPFARFRFRRGFGFPFCSPVFAIGFTTRNFRFFDRELVCFPRPFVSPFFFPFAPVVGSTVLLVPPEVVYVPASPAMTQQEEAAGESYAPPGTAAGEAPQTTQPSEPRAARPLTLLQLKDGAMYALTDYWIEGGQLHYITSYGGENAVPIDRVDLDKTVQLNWDRGVEFVLRPKPAAR
jgi:hypothetical protein